MIHDLVAEYSQVQLFLGIFCWQNSSNSYGVWLKVNPKAEGLDYFAV